MNLKFNFLLLFLCFSFLGFSQDMKEGFTYLETGKYAEAETFFTAILEKYPTNKTARLCYGRAVGLNGNAKKAVKLFTSLLKDYPTSFEVKLNYAESLLWGKKYKAAKKYYEKLIAEDDKSFAALLGYANTLSNLKIYDKALEFVNKALEVLPGNPNALVSKKYIHLGYANKYIQDQKYPEAIELLKKNLTFFENDKETLLNLANAYLISKDYDGAKNTYENIATTPKDSVGSLNGLALVYHLAGKEKDALKTSEKALVAVAKIEDTELKNRTDERYAQALIWNKKYKQAKKVIDGLLKKHPNKNWVLSLEATLNIYKSNFKESILIYSRILKNKASSFDGNLGLANALKAYGLYDYAYKYAEKTLTYYKKQKDATNFIRTLNGNFTPFVETKSSYSFDNGDNEAYAHETKVEFPFSTKFKLLGSHQYRTTSNPTTLNDATSNDATFGFAYQLTPKIIFKGIGGFSAVTANDTNYRESLLDVSFNIKPLKLQILDIGYRRDLQTFNAELLDRQIIQNNLYMNYSVSSNFNLGWFTQYFYTTQSDENVRNLLFTSLYYNILSKPGLKGGINYQYLSFKNQVPTIYFSPAQFNAVEVFVDLIKDEGAAKKKEWFYNLNAAYGLQYVEDDPALSAYRVQAKLGYKFSERALINIYGLRSNIAAAAANTGSKGFIYTEMGIRFKWLFLEKPVFRK